MINFEPAFAFFLSEAQRLGAEDYKRFAGMDHFTKHGWGITLVAERGKRFIRIVAEGNGQRSAWAFVDMTNGDVLKADGWKGPAKGARGNIFDSHNGTGRVRWTGIR